MTTIALSAPAATGPPPGPVPTIGAGEGGTSARTTASAGPFTAEASPFDHLLALLTAAPPSPASGGGEETTSDGKDTGADEDTPAAASPDGSAAAPAALGLAPVPPLTSGTAGAGTRPSPTPAPAGLDAGAPVTAPGGAALVPPGSDLPAPAAGSTSPADGTPAAPAPFTAPTPAAVTPAPSEPAQVRAAGAAPAGQEATTPAPPVAAAVATAPDVAEARFAADIAARTAPVEAAGSHAPAPGGPQPLPHNPSDPAPVREPGEGATGPEKGPGVRTSSAATAPDAVPAAPESGGKALAEAAETGPGDAPATDATAQEQTAPAAASGGVAVTRDKAAERPDTAARVVEPVRTLLREMPATPGRQEVTLSLSPDSLGELRIRVSATPGGEVRAAIVATTAEAKASLETAMEGLRHTLAERGLRLEGFTVSLTQAAPGGAGEQGNPGGDARQAATGGQTFSGNSGHGPGSQGAPFRPSSAPFAGYAGNTEGADRDRTGPGLSPLPAGRVNLLA